MALTDFVYVTPGYPAMKVKSMNMNFSPKFVELANLDLIIGKSDINASGRIDNFLAYVFRDETIKGTFNLNSNYFNLDELMAEDPAASSATATPSTTADTASGIVLVPTNIDFVLNSNFKKIDYDNMPIDNLKGTLTVKDGAVNFKETTFNILGGGIKIDGSYDTKNTNNPTANMDFAINNMDIPTAFKTFNTMEKLAPIGKNAKGNFSTTLKFNTSLLPDMTADFKSLNGNGTMSTKSVMIENHKLFEKVADALKNPKYKKIKAEDLKVAYEIKDGKMNIKPFDIKIGTSTAKVYGWTSFEQTMEYTFEFKIPRSEFGGEANAILNGLEAQANKYGAKVSVGEFVFVNVIASGPVTNPKIKIVPKGMGGENKSMKDQAGDLLKAKEAELKAQAKAELDKQKKELEAKAQAEIDKQKREAEAKIKAETDRQKKELENKVKQETQKQEKAVKNQAKDLLKGFK